LKARGQNVISETREGNKTFAGLGSKTRNCDERGESCHKEEAVVANGPYRIYIKQQKGRKERKCTVSGCKNTCANKHGAGHWGGKRKTQRGKNNGEWTKTKNSARGNLSIGLRCWWAIALNNEGKKKGGWVSRRNEKGEKARQWLSAIPNTKRRM